MNDDELPRTLPGIALGESLESISLSELEQRVQALESEIARIRAEIQKKLASKTAADAFFRN